MIKKAEYWIVKLNLEKHPEGGYFRETYRSDLLIEKLTLLEAFSCERLISTTI
ncbi:MAG: cupin domain-containing protein [Spirochaetota bacterium]|nr:cupin domain-containing protein [Spirochaetota bacterium]